MLIPETGKKRILMKIIAFIMAQVFFVASIGYAELLYNKTASSPSAGAKNLRAPMGFDKESFDTEVTYRVIASMVLQTIAYGLKQGLNLDEIIKKSFDTSFKKQLKAPIEIHMDLSTRVIYINYGNIYMSLNPAGVMADSNEQEFKAVIKEVAVIRADEEIKSTDGQQQPVQLSLWDVIPDTAQPQLQKVVSMHIDMLVNKLQFENEPTIKELIESEKLTMELVKIAGESLEATSQVAESILNKFVPGMKPFLAQYLTSILGRISETHPQITMALINKIAEKMSLDEERPDIKNYLEGVLDEIAAISPKRASFIRELKRAYSILGGIKGLNKDKALLLNIKPYLIEQGGVMLGLGQNFRIMILSELLREGLLENDELQAAFLHEIMHAERHDEKIWPEIVNMDDRNLAEKKVQDIELEVDRLAVECLVLHGRDPKAMVRLLEKSDAVCDVLIAGGFLQPSDDSRAIPTPLVSNRIANVNIYLTDRDFEEAKKLHGETAIEALQEVIAAYLEIKKSLFNGSPLDGEMTEYIEKQLFAAREIAERNALPLLEQALPAVATRTGV